MMNKLDQQLLGKTVRITSGPYRNQTGIALGEHPSRERGILYMVGNVVPENPRRVVSVHPQYLEPLQF